MTTQCHCKNLKAMGKLGEKKGIFIPCYTLTRNEDYWCPGWRTGNVV